MRLFWKICAISIQRQLAYRAAAMAGLLTNLFFGLLRAAVLVALYGSRTVVTGISIEGAITYTGITQGIIGFLSLFSWYELMSTVYSGAIASDLVKPLNYYRFWMAQDFGRALAQLILRGLPIMVIYAVRVQYNHTNIDHSRAGNTCINAPCLEYQFFLALSTKSELFLGTKCDGYIKVRICTLLVSIWFFNANPILS